MCALLSLPSGIGVLLGVDGFDGFDRLAQQVFAQRGKRLLPVPRTAVGRTQMGDDLLEVGEAGLFQRRQVEHGRRGGWRQLVQLHERQFDLARCRDGRHVKECHRVIVGIGVRQRGLQPRGKRIIIELGDEQRQAYVDQRVMLRRDARRRHQLAAGCGVDADCRQRVSIGKRGMSKRHGRFTRLVRTASSIT